MLPLRNFGHEVAKENVAARWIEHCIKTVIGADASVDSHTRVWLYPILADHWTQQASTGVDAALQYLERAAKGALDANMNHEAIQFLHRMLKQA